IVLPHTGPAGRSRVALGATVDVGDVEVRIYSVHSETRIPVTDKMEQLQTVIDDANRFPKARAIIMGDFNTWELPAVESTRQLFTAAGFDTPFSDDDTTFLRKVPLLGIKLKLDWIWLRGVSVQSYDIDRTIAVSDHFPLGVVATPQVSPGRSSPSISSNNKPLLTTALFAEAPQASCLPVICFGRKLSQLLSKLPRTH